MLFPLITRTAIGHNRQKQLLRSTSFLTFPLLCSLLLNGCWAPLSTDLRPENKTEILQLPLPEEDLTDNTKLTPFPLDWWSLFHDRQLVELEKIAAENNLDLQIGAARINESSAVLGITSSANKPDIAGSAGYTRAGISDEDPLAMLGIPTSPFDWYEVGFQARWELDLWGHVQHQLEAAQLRLQATDYEMEWARVSVAARVARTYLSLRGIEESITLLKEDCTTVKSLLELAQSRQKNGVGTRQETAEYAAMLATSKSRLPELNKAAHTMKSNLAMLLGKNPGELDGLKFSSPQNTFTTPLPLAISSEWARRRPDILAAESRLNATLADILTAQADFYPRLSLHGGVGLEAISLSSLGSWDARQFAIGPTVYLPLFTGGRLQKKLALTEATQRHAAITYQKTVLEAWHEINIAINGCTSESNRLHKLKRAESRTREALDGAVREQQEGVGSMDQVLHGRRKLLQSQSAIIDARTKTGLELVALYQALGGGWSNEKRTDAATGE